MHIYKHGVKPNAAAPLSMARSLYPVQPFDFEPQVSEAEKRFRLRLFGRARGADRMKEQEFYRADEEMRMERLVNKLEEKASSTAPNPEAPHDEQPATDLTETEQPLVDRVRRRLDLTHVQLSILAPFADVLKGGLEALEKQERERARVLEGRREAVTNGVLHTSRYLRPLLYAPRPRAPPPV